MMHNHRAINVKCTMDEPIQLLIDKLSSKSSDLYIFWQNYNQLYLSYNEKLLQIQRLLHQNELLRQDRSHTVLSVPAPQQKFFKERFLVMEKNVQELKNQIQRVRMENRQLKKQNQKVQDQNLQLQNILQHLRQQNTIQRTNIERILIELKNAQNQINNMYRVYEDLNQKETILSRYVSKQKQLLEHIAQLQKEIDQMGQQSRQTKALYQKLIKQSMNSAKNRVVESLPGLIQSSKHRVQLFSTDIS